MSRHHAVITSSWLCAHIRSHGGRLWVISGLAVVG